MKSVSNHSHPSIHRNTDSNLHTNTTACKYWCIGNNWQSTLVWTYLNVDGNIHYSRSHTHTQNTHPQNLSTHPHTQWQEQTGQYHHHTHVESRDGSSIYPPFCIIERGISLMFPEKIYIYKRDVLKRRDWYNNIVWSQKNTYSQWEKRRLYVGSIATCSAN